MISTARRPTARMASILLVASAAEAGPNLPYDDPSWITLRDSIAKGVAPDATQPVVARRLVDKGARQAHAGGSDAGPDDSTSGSDQPPAPAGD